MLNTLKIYFLLLIFCSTQLSCKKELPDARLGKLDLSGGFALVVQETPDNSALKTGQEPEFAKLYKLTVFDTLQTVKYFTPDGAEMGFTYIPEAVYNLNGSYLFLTLSRQYSSPKVFESYLINKYDGKAIAIEPQFHPQMLINNEIVVDNRSKAFRQALTNEFFCYFDLSLGKITFSGVEGYAVSQAPVTLVLDKDYTIDNEGNIFTDGKVITSASTLDVTSYVADKSTVVKSFDKGFFMATAKDTSIEVSKIFIENGEVKTQVLADLGKGSIPWELRGGASFKTWSNAFFVFDKGMVRINSQETKLLSLAPFSLTGIDLFDYSDKNFYITGTNVLNKKVFMLINPSTNPVGYTQTIAPDKYNFKKLEVTFDSNVTIVATRNSDNREVMIYLPGANNYIEKTNHQGIKIKQLVAIK